ncbi:MAG: hypothetical protein JSR71_13615 [Proteobacteria bacterium]|nr:hypothetical protein [Pseudomonadota bacterium]
MVACSFVVSAAVFAQEDISDRTPQSIGKKTFKNKKRQKRKTIFFYGNAGSGLRWNGGKSEIRLAGFVQADTPLILTKRLIAESFIDTEHPGCILARQLCQTI